jgi:hypothetical protein
MIQDGRAALGPEKFVGLGSRLFNSEVGGAEET